jgi:Na+/melibiose symporter-like transporter
MSTTDAASKKAPSFVAPFRHAAFTVIWTATLVSNVGGWMYSAASGWLMTSLNPDPLIVALVQAASTLPICLFAVPAGALADIFDKRKFLIVVETLTTAVCAVYAVMVGLGLATPGNLLLFTFLIGAAGAMTVPAWQAVVPLLVPRDDLHAGIAANSVGVNIFARARSGARRGDDLGLRHCSAVLGQRDLQSRHRWRVAVVARGETAQLAVAGGAFRPGDLDGPSLRPA